MPHILYLLKLGPPAGCSPSPWSSIASCIPSLIDVWRRLPKHEQPRLVWAGQGESLIAPPSHIEPKALHLWDLALIVHYPKDVNRSDSTRVESVGQFVDVYCIEIQDIPADFQTTAPNASTATADIPASHSLPGYSRLRRMYEQSPRPGTPIHMINLLHFVPKTGKRQYEQYLEACASALGNYGAKIAYHGDVTAKGEKQWDSLLIGAYPDKRALISGVTDPRYTEAFKIREKALADAMLLATVPVDLTAYEKLARGKL